MAIELPSGLAGLFKVLTGMEWPQGNEDQLRAVGQLYSGTADDFDQLADLVTELTAAIKRKFEGDTATAFVASMQDLVGGKNYIGTAKDGAAELAQFADDTANQIEYMKWMILGTLIELAAELAFYAATAWFNWGAPAEAAAAEVAAQITIRAVMRAVLKYLLQHVVLGLATALAMDAIIQYIQIRQHHRSGFDGKLTLQAVEFAGISSVLGAVLGPLGNKFGSVLGDLLGKNFGKDVGKDLAKIFPKSLTSLAGDGAKDFANDLGRVVGDNGRGLANAFTKDAEKDAGQDAGKDLGNDTGKEAGQDGPGGTFDSGAADGFSHDMGEVFGKHLGDTLGKDDARRLGRDFADEFVAGWGHQDLAAVKDALHDVVGPYADRLGADGARALSHDLPEAVLANMVKSTGPDVGRKLAELTTTSLTSGVNMTLTTGFYNLIFGPDHSFETSFGSFGGGAVMGALGHGGRMAIDRFSPHVSRIDVPDFEGDFGKGLKFGGPDGAPGADSGVPRPPEPEPAPVNPGAGGGPAPRDDLDSGEPRPVPTETRGYDVGTDSGEPTPSGAEEPAPVPVVGGAHDDPPPPTQPEAVRTVGGDTPPPATRTAPATDDHAEPPSRVSTRSAGTAPPRRPVDPDPDADPGTDSAVRAHSESGNVGGGHDASPPPVPPRPVRTASGHDGGSPRQPDGAATEFAADFVPAPHWAPHDEARSADWRDAQARAADRRDGELDDAAGAFGREQHFEDVFRQWSDRHPELPDDVRDRVHENALAQQRRFGETDEFVHRSAQESLRALERHRVVEETVDRVRGGFDASFLSWSGHTGRLADGGDHRPEPADEHADLRDLVRDDNDTAGRVHQAAWGEAERQVRSLADRLDPSMLDATPEQLDRRAAQLTAMAAPGLHDLITRAARDDVRRGQASRDFDRDVPPAPETVPGEGADGALSGGGRERLRREWENQLDDDHREIFGELSDTPGWRGLVGGPRGAARSEPGHRPDREEHDQHAWEERRRQRAAELPGRVELQLLKESAARDAVSAVREASDGSWKQSLDDLGGGFTDAFTLDRRDATDGAQREAARSLGDSAHEELDRWAANGDRDAEDARRVVTDSTGADVARRRVAVAVARSAAVERAGFDARRLAAEQAPSAPQDAVDRFVEGHQERVGSLFDGVFGGAPGGHGPLDDRLPRWNDGRDSLDGELAGHLRFETSATAGLSHWADGFRSAADGREVSEDDLSRIGEQTREDWFTAYHGLWGPEDLNARHWLDHEAGNGGRFDNAPRDPDPGERADAPHLDDPADQEPDDRSLAVAPRTSGGSPGTRPAERTTSPETDLYHAVNLALRKYRGAPHVSREEVEEFRRELADAGRLQSRRNVRDVANDIAAWSQGHDLPRGPGGAPNAVHDALARAGVHRSPAAGGSSRSQGSAPHPFLRDLRTSAGRWVMTPRVDPITGGPVIDPMTHAPLSDQKYVPFEPSTRIFRLENGRPVGMTPVAVRTWLAEAGVDVPQGGMRDAMTDHLYGSGDPVVYGPGDAHRLAGELRDLSSLGHASGQDQVLDAVVQAAGLITDRYPPERFFYLGLGRSPVAIVAALQQMGHHADSVPLSDFRPGPGDPWSVLHDVFEQRGGAGLTGDQQRMLFEHFDEFVLPHVSGRDKDIVLVDYTQTGLSLFAAQHHLGVYLRGKGLPVRVRALAMHQDIDASKLGESVDAVAVPRSWLRHPLDWYYNSGDRTAWREGMSTFPLGPGGAVRDNGPALGHAFKQEAFDGFAPYGSYKILQQTPAQFVNNRPLRSHGDASTGYRTLGELVKPRLQERAHPADGAERTTPPGTDLYHEVNLALRKYRGAPHISRDEVAQLHRELADAGRLQSRRNVRDVANDIAAWSQGHDLPRGPGAAPSAVLDALARAGVHPDDRDEHDGGPVASGSGSHPVAVAAPHEPPHPAYAPETVGDFAHAPKDFLAQHVVLLRMDDGMRARTPELGLDNRAFLRWMDRQDRHWFTLTRDPNRSAGDRDVFLLTPAVEKYHEAFADRDEQLRDILGGRELPAVRGPHNYLAAHYVPYYQGGTVHPESDIGHAVIPKEPNDGFSPDFVFTGAMNGCAFVVTRGDDPESFTAWHYQSPTSNRADSGLFRRDRRPSDWFGDSEYQSLDPQGIPETTNVMWRGEHGWEFLSQENHSHRADPGVTALQRFQHRPVTFDQGHEWSYVAKLYRRGAQDRSVRLRDAEEKYVGRLGSSQDDRYLKAAFDALRLQTERDVAELTAASGRDDLVARTEALVADHQMTETLVAGNLIHTAQTRDNRSGWMSRVNEAANDSPDRRRWHVRRIIAEETAPAWLNELRQESAALPPAVPHAAQQADVAPGLPGHWPTPVATQGGQAVVHPPRTTEPAADGDESGALWGSGEVRTDRWIPFGSRGGGHGGPEAFEFQVAPDGTPTGVRRPAGSGERTQVGYAWQWRHGETPDGDVLVFTRRLHLRSAGASDDEIAAVRRGLTGALDQVVNERGHRLPVPQQDRVTGPRRPGPRWRTRVEFVDTPDEAHGVVEVRGGSPTADDAMLQGVWYPDVDPTAYVHEVLHGFGVWDDDADPRALLTPGGRAEQALSPGESSVMAPPADPATAPRPVVTADHLRQIAEVFAPYSHAGAGPAHRTSADSATDSDLRPAMPSARNEPVPVEELLEHTLVVRYEGETVAVWLPGTDTGALERSADTLDRLSGFAGPDRVLVFGAADDGGVVADGRPVTVDALASLIALASPGRTPVLTMPVDDRVAADLARLTDRPVVASRHGARFDPVEGTLTEAPAPSRAAQPAVGFRRFGPQDQEGVPAFDDPHRVPWSPPSPHRDSAPPREVPVPAPDPDPVPGLGERVAAPAAVRSVGIPRAGLPNVPSVMRRLRAMVEQAGVTVAQQVWDRLPQRLLANYRYLVPEEGDPAHDGLLVPLGPVEALISLDPRDPRSVPAAESSYDRPTALATIPEADEPDEPKDSDGAAPTGPLPLRSDRGDAPEPFHATGLVNASYLTGAFVRTHSGQTSVTRGGLSVTWGVGVAPGVLKFGGGVSGGANASSRSTIAVGDAEGGHVLDVRAEPRLLAYRPVWTLRIRTAADARWDDVAPTTLETDGDERLMLWVPEHLLKPAPAQIHATGTGGLEHRLPAIHYAAGLTGLPALVDHIVSALTRQGLKLPIGGPARDELLQKVWNLDAHLDESIGDRRGYQFQLHDEGRPVATVELHTVRASRGTRFGETTDVAHVENVRTAIDGTGGGHTVNQSSTVTFPSAEFDLVPLPFKNPALSLGWTASLALTWSNSDGHNAGRTGLWVVVPRFTGFTPAYELNLTHSAIVSVRGKEPARTPTVSGNGLVVLPEPAALEHGFDVDEAALRGGAVTVLTGLPPAARDDSPPPSPVVSQRADAEGEFGDTWSDAPVVEELPDGAAPPEGVEVVRPSEVTEPDEPPAPPAPVTVYEDPDGRRTVEYAPGLLRRTGRRDDDPAHLDVPPHVAEGKGIGMGLVDVDKETIGTLHSRLEAELTRLGFLPKDRTAPLTDAHWWSHGNRLDSQLENHELLDKYVSARGFESHYDQLHQSSMVFTMYKRRGTLGVDLDVDAVKITISAKKSADAPPEYEGTTDEFHTVNLAMGMDTAGQFSGGGKKIGLSFRFKVLFNQLKGSGHGFDLFRQVGATQGVSYLHNRPELLEYPGAVNKHGLFSDYTVTMELQHSGLQGRIRRGVRNPAPIELPRQRALAYLLPLGDLNHPGVTSVRRTPASVLRHAVVYHVDAGGLHEAATTVLGELTGPHGNADQELTSFTSTIMTRAHLKEILAAQYTTDQFFDTGWFRNTFGAVDINGRMGRTAFAGATKDKFVLGVIQLSMGQTSTSDTTSHGVNLVEADITVGGPADPHDPDGIGFLRGGVDGNRSWQRNVSEGEGRTGAKELIQLDFNRAYAYRTTVDFVVRNRLEKHGKFVPQSHRSDRQEVNDRTALFVLSEPAALEEYGRDNLPVSDEQLADVMNRWARGETRLSGNTVASVLSRWTVDAPELPELPEPLESDRAELAATLAKLHDSGALTVLDERVRTAFSRRFKLALRDPKDRYSEVTLPEYLTREDPGGRMLGHSGVQHLSYDNGKTTYDIVREQVERTAPGLLASDPEVWTADGRRIGRLQGSVNALQGLLADGRDVAMWDNLLSLNGQSFYLVNPIGWLLSDIVEIKLSDVLDSAPDVHDFKPDTGLENYGHGYVSTSRTVSRDSAQSFTASKFGGGETNSYDQASLAFGTGHHRSATRAETGTTEQTAYAWDGHYRVDFGHTLTVGVRRLNMAGRPLNNLLAGWYRNLDPDRAATNTVSVSGTVGLQIPRGIAEFKPVFGPRPPRDLRPLPALPGDAYVAGVLLDEALPAGLKLLTGMFGPGADGATTRTSLTIGELLGRTQLSNHLPEASAGNRYLLTDTLFVPGHSGKRAKLWMKGDLYDVHVLGPVKGTGTGRYVKHQSGTTSSASNDRWAPTTGLGTFDSGVIHDHDPATTRDGRDYAPYTAEGDESTSRATGGNLAGAGTENYRREQHAKAQGPVHLVRLRGRFRLEAERYNRHLLWPTTRKGGHRSDAFTGDVYAELFQGEVDELLARVARQEHTAARGDLGWLELDDAPHHDLSALLADAAGGRGARADRAAESVARGIRRATTGPLDAVVLTLDTAELDARAFGETVRWAVDTMRADLARARTAAPGTPEPAALARYQDHLGHLPALPELPGPVAESIGSIIRDVNAVRGRLTGDPDLPPVALPPIVSFQALSHEHLVRDIAHELDAHVRVDITLPGGTRRSRWVQPSGHVRAFDPLDPGAPGADRLTSRDAEAAGLLTPDLRRAVDEFGFDDGELGDLYRESWQHARSFGEEVHALVERRRTRLESLDDRLPGLLERAVRQSTVQQPPDAGESARRTAVETADRAREALEGLRALARDTAEPAPGQVRALVDNVRLLLGRARAVDLDSHIFSVLTQEGGHSSGVLDRDELPDAADEVWHSVRDDAAPAPTGPDADVRDMGWCVSAVEAFRARVFPRSLAVAGSGVRSGGALGDEAIGLDRAADRLALGAGWTRIGSWDAVGSALRDAGEGSLALGLTRNPFGEGHALVAYYPRYAPGQDEGPVWIEMSADGVRLSAEPPDVPALQARAVVIGADGRVEPDALEPFSASTSTAHALLDGSIDRGYGMLSGSSGWRSVFGSASGSSSGRAEVSAERISFTNLTAKYPEYVRKAEHVLQLLASSPVITGYLGGRRADIVLEKRTTETPAEVVDLGEEGVRITLAAYYFEKYDIGYVAGMLAHEFGIHPVANSRPMLLEEESMFHGMPIPVPGLGEKLMNTEGAKQADHVLGAIPNTPRYEVYKSIVLELAQRLMLNLRDGTHGAKAQDVTDLLDCYLMDVATIAATNDNRLLGVPGKPGSSEVRVEIATVYNHYRGLLARELDPLMEVFLPPGKTADGVQDDFLTLAGRVLSGALKAWSISGE